MSGLTHAQNLLPNGSFELTTDLDYMDPASAFLYLDFWYPANNYPNDPTFNGSPDLFSIQNPWPRSFPLNFWNIAYSTIDGDFHIGLANHLTFEGYSTPEAVATPLIQPLETNEFYHIELQVRNKGVSGYLDHAPILCVPGENKQIDLLLDKDSIYVVIDKLNKDSYSDASKVIALHSPQMESESVHNWQKTGTCFQADGGEKFLGITTTSGRFSVDPPCVIYDEHWDVFYIYYFDIDDVKLTKLPNEVNLYQTICAGRKTEFNMDSLAGLPTMQREIEYHWDDGRIDSINYISEAGTYHINAVVDCKTIPITLEVTEERCDPDVFVPNAFSPNGDGINDLLDVFIAVDLPVMNYKLSVFNRWGSMVFSTNAENNKWDGSLQGEKMDNGIYFWLLEYTVDDPELGIKNYKESGDVMIAR